MDSSRQGTVPMMTPSRVTGGGLSQSSTSSGIFFQGDVQSHNLMNSHLSSSFGNSANSGISGIGRSNLGPSSSDVNQTVFNSVGNSGPSVGASSLVTDANSGFSGGPHLQRSASINTDSYIRVPASPMSFTSNNNVGISGSSAIDGPASVQQGSHHDLNSQQTIQSQQTILGPRINNSFMMDPSLSQLQKKPRLDFKQEDILQQQVLQQFLQRQDPMQLQSNNPQFQAFIQQQRLRQQQQILQAMPPMQRVQLQQQQQQQQLRQHMQQQNLHQMASMKNPYDIGGVCARRLMQYLYHQRQHPPENTIAYWRKFVAEYFAPRARKRWCLSLYDNVGHHGLGIFPQSSMDPWHCDICGSKSGRGFEATYEVLPRLCEIEFGSGVVDELLFVDLPREGRYANGIMTLEYTKVVQESVYEHLRVIREGQLRIIFTQDLKILSWDFCVRRHEELLPRRLVAPQVTQLLQAAQKCQSTQADSGSEGVASSDTQASGNMVLMASRQLAKSLELQPLNDLGFSKRYVRCFQIAEVVNSMKDLIDFCRDNKVGPIEGLKSYPRHASTSKLQMQRMQEMEQLANIQGLPTDRNTINKLLAMQQFGINNHSMSNNHDMMGNRSSLTSPTPAALALTNYQNVMMRQNSINSQEASSSLMNSNQSPSSSFRGSPNLHPGSMHNLPTGGISDPQLAAQQYQQHRTLNNNSSTLACHQNQQALQGNQALQQQMIQQLLQNMSQPKTLGGQNVSAGYGNNGTPATPAQSSNVSGGGGRPMLSKNNSFKTGSNSDSSAAIGGSGGGGGANSGSNQKAPNMLQNLHLTDDMVPDLPHDFAESGFFGSDLDESMGYAWKG